MILFSRILIIQCGIWCAFAGYAQKEIEIPVSHRVVMNFQEYIVYADILASERKFNPKSGKYYFWYSANDIKRTRGGYDGKLLHGAYTEFFPDKNLKQKGMFRYGLKKGVWKTWYHSGEIESVVRWRKGSMQGGFRHYDEQGRLVRQGRHKNDLMHGKIDTFSSEGRQRHVYVNGLKKEEKPGRSQAKKSADNDKPEKAKSREKENRDKENKEKEAVGTEVRPDEKRKEKTEGPVGEKSRKVSKEKSLKAPQSDSSQKRTETKSKKTTERDRPKPDQKTAPQGN